MYWPEEYFGFSIVAMVVITCLFQRLALCAVDYVAQILWIALHLLVYVFPGLYWRAGAELHCGCVRLGGYTGTRGRKNDPSTWKRHPMTYRNVAEHHGFVDPKVCRFPSFTKVYASAAHYAEADQSLRRVHLVFIPRGAVHTLPIIEDDDLFLDMLFQSDGFIPSLRYSDLHRAYDYALSYAKMPGGVHITNHMYIPLLSFRTTFLDRKADAWWTWGSEPSFLLACGW